VPQYEVIVVLEPALSDEAVDGEINRVREIVGRLNGTVQEVQKWGKKRLAYEVRRRREAHYVLLKVDGPPTLAAEVDRHCRVTEPVLKVLTVRADPRTSAPPPPPRRKPGERAGEAPPPADTAV
jgi:small subunit ribosomal protein S6